MSAKYLKIGVHSLYDGQGMLQAISGNNVMVKRMAASIDISIAS